METTIRPERTVNTTVAPGPSADTWTVTFRTEARPGTLAAFAGTLTALRLDIVSACVTLGGDGTVIDVFDVIPLEGDGFGPDSAPVLSRTACDVLNGRCDLSAELMALRSGFTPRADIAPAVDVKTDSDVTTGFNVVCADRPGLLYDITRTLTRAGLRTRSLSVLTFSGRAHDAFRVIGQDGEPPRDPIRLEALRRELLHVCGGA